MKDGDVDDLQLGRVMIRPKSTGAAWQLPSWHGSVNGHAQAVVVSPVRAVEAARPMTVLR